MVGVPESLQQLIGRRLAKLSPEEQQILEAVGSWQSSLTRRLQRGRSRWWRRSLCSDPASVPPQSECDTRPHGSHHGTLARAGVRLLPDLGTDPAGLGLGRAGTG
jgi:hypothetical protein